MKTSILNYYPMVLEVCYNHLQKPVPRAVRQIYHWAAENSRLEQEDLMRIQMDLSQTIQSEPILNGAYFCSYNSFRHIYPIFVRTAERENFALAIMLISLHPRKNAVGSRQDTSLAMNLAHQIILSTLRKDDIFCQFSRSQYAALLMMKNYNDKQFVEMRLSNVFSQESRLKNFTITISFCHPDLNI